MDDPGQLINGKIAVGGIKFSQELVLVTISGDDGDSSDFNVLLKELSNSCIPLLFLCQSNSPSGCFYSFCVDAPDSPAVLSILTQFPRLSKKLNTISPAGVLTVFPHRNDPALLGRLLSVFNDKTVPLYGFCTSISATAFCTDYLLLETVTDLMLHYIQLPENHAPFQPEFLLKQPR